jgi:predicted SnoaL-like aldol condensation-catalyzing enzyme
VTPSTAERHKDIVRRLFDAFRTGNVDVEVYRMMAEGDLVAARSHDKTLNAAVVDIRRINDEGRLIEHWDVVQPVPETTASGNDMFAQLT